MKHTYDEKKQNIQGEWRYHCSCGFVAQSEGASFFTLRTKTINSNIEIRMMPFSQNDTSGQENGKQ